MRKTSKIKRIFAGLLALILAVALLPAQTARIAKADDPKPTINTSNAVSLTIYKYRYDGNTPGTATGTSADLLSIPDGAQLLKGVTFDVYKVADIVQQDGNKLKYQTVSDVKTALEAVHAGDDYTYINGGLNSTEIKSLFTSDVITRISSLKKTKVTNESGIAQFSNAELGGQGLFLVVESDAPAVVTTMADPFLVSLPMTDVTNKNDWIYDVYVFPKNGTTTGGIMLKKQGKIGGTTTAIEGAKFKLQKQQSDSTWKDLLKNDNGGDIGTAGVITVPNVGSTISGLSKGKYRFVEIAVPNDTGYILDTVTTYEFEVSIAATGGTDENGNSYNTGDLLITYGGKTYLSKGATIPVYTVTNYKPDVEKKVLKRDGNKATAGDWADAADYSVGDKIPYCIQVDVPENVALLRSFEITDTLVNQDYDTGSLKIYSDAALSNDITTTLGVTVDTSGGTNTWKIEFNSFDADTGSTSTTGTTSKLALTPTYAGKTIYIYFTATLTNDAVVTSDGNKNNVNLNYSNTIVPAKDAGNNEVPAPKKDIVHDEAIVYTFEIEVVKKDGKTNTALNGVEFDLYREINAGETIDASSKLTDAEVTRLGLPTSTNGYVKVNLTTLSTDANGKINVHGLENGTYYLVETKALEGYNLLKEPVKVKISASYSITSAESTQTDAGTGITTTQTVILTNQYDNTGTNGVITTEILNNKGFTLPTTGGVGSVIFVFVGVSMMIAAVIMFWQAIKKKDNKKASK